MLIFGIDTCCMAATAALLKDDRLVAQTVVNHEKTHSQKMMPQIAAMMEWAEIDPLAVDCFAAAIGPGSFTGVRIGVATVKAMAQAASKPCAGVSTLHALANNVAVFDGVICPILDARRNQVYNALFRGAEGVPERLTPDRALKIHDLLKELDAMAGRILFVGDGLQVFQEEIEEALGARARFAPAGQRMNLAASVAELGAQMLQANKTVPYGELTPQYVRLSQAERERIERQKNTAEGMIKCE